MITMDTLFSIQKLAKTNKDLAEKKLFPLVKEIFPDLKISKLRIEQKDYSLNSVYGFITINKKEYFFKFHSEEGEEKTLKEYYLSDKLNKAGYPIIMPVYKSTKPGKQFLIYEKFRESNLFDLLDLMDRQYLGKKFYDKKLLKKVIKLEQDFDKKIIKIALSTLKKASNKLVAKEELNQLFYRRLVAGNTTPRLDLFYKNKKVLLPSGETIKFENLKKLKWIINGIVYEETLEELINQAKKLLNPNRLEEHPVIIAHGDDHNGNKVITNQGLIYYDPAFAGENQYALLSFVKTTFHDTLAHPLWLYSSKDFKLNLKMKLTSEYIIVNTDFDFEKSAPIRAKLLGIKLNNTWIPLIKELKKRKLLEKDYIDYIRKAFFTCPFLVFNLIDNTKYTPDQSIFALSQSVMIGSTSTNGPMEEFFQKLEGAI